MTTERKINSILVATLCIALGSSTLLAEGYTRADFNWGRSGVIELTDSNFDEKVFGSNDVWLVMFYAPWCGASKYLKPIYEEAARAIKRAGIENVKLAAVDAHRYREIKVNYNIFQYPTLKYFPAGSKTSDDAQEYESGETASAIVQWAKNMSGGEGRLLPEGVIERTIKRVQKVGGGCRRRAPIGYRKFRTYDGGRPNIREMTYFD